MLQKTDKYMAIAAACMLILSACNAEVAPSVTDPDQQLTKTLIEPTVGIVGDNPVTKVVTTDNPYGQSATKFATGTSLYMVMKSDDGAGVGEAKYSRTIGYAQEDATSTSTKVKFATSYERFYEDSYSRNSKVSIYSACVPGYYLAGSVYSGVTPNGTSDGTTWTIGGSATYNSNTWSIPATPEAATAATEIAWPLRGQSVDHQTGTFGAIDSQDLCFSNNVSNVDSDNRIYFDDGSLSGSRGFKSENGMHMIFHHALTKVTFKIKKGAGFSGDIAFDGEGVGVAAADRENIVLAGFNSAGTFNLASGTFGTPSTTTIKELAPAAAEGDYTLVRTCLMLPGTALTSTKLDDITFVINDNRYHLSMSQLAGALTSKTLTNTSLAALDAGSTMRPGVHYIFTMTVGKKAVDQLTASVVDWEDVSANVNPTNARILIDLEEAGDKVTGTVNYSIYRSGVDSGTVSDSFVDYDNWKTGYVDNSKGRLTETVADSGTYKAEDAASPNAQWYWPDNKTFYHFRTVAPNTTVVTEDETNGDHFPLTGAVSYTDVLWGAPFANTDAKLSYSTTNGFDGKTPHQIYKAIGATNGTINMVMFHMMSDVKIILATTTGDDKVTLIDDTPEPDVYTSLSFNSILPTGKVRMGTGLVVADGTAAPVAGNINSSKQWTYGFVPQSLAGVVLTITTPDNNEYKVDMDGVVAATVGNTVLANPYTDNVIDYWYPGYKYTYTFTLTKTGITQITATLADWETVTASDEVQIK